MRSHVGFWEMKVILERPLLGRKAAAVRNLNEGPLSGIRFGSRNGRLWGALPTDCFSQELPDSKGAGSGLSGLVE